MEWLRLMRLLRWILSTILFALLWYLGEKVVGLLIKPEPWYVSAAAMLLLLAGAVGWVAATYYLGKIVRDAEF